MCDPDETKYPATISIKKITRVISDPTGVQKVDKNYKGLVINKATGKKFINKSYLRLLLISAVQSLMKGCTVYFLPKQVVEHYLRLENITVTVATHRQIGDKSGMDSLMGKELLESLTSKLYCLGIGIGYCKWSLRLHT